MEFYHSRVTELGELFDGVPEMLDTLKEQGYTLALLSDKGEVYGTRELESMGIGGLFDYVLFMTGGRAYKPDPAGLRQVMDALSVGKDQALYVGDSHVDVQCRQEDRRRQCCCPLGFLERRPGAQRRARLRAGERGGRCGDRNCAGLGFLGRTRRGPSVVDNRPARDYIPFAPRPRSVR